MGCWIVEHDGMEMLYYQGWNLGVTVSFYVAIGLAVRPAGQPDRPFERISEGPILGPAVRSRYSSPIRQFSIDMEIGGPGISPADPGAKKKL